MAGMGTYTSSIPGVRSNDHPPRTLLVRLSAVELAPERKERERERERVCFVAILAQGTHPLPLGLSQ